ncbi:MAG: response regulator transcription factor [Blautia sp.]|jgi:two-component system response regulator YesN
MDRIKVMIADDEKKICMLLRSLINWESLDMEIVGEANNGIDALALLEQTKPEIAILDIRMPGMDGLELLQKIRESDDKVKVILISGHKHFEYAHTALQYGVENYLLKPVNREELLDNLQIVKGKILQQAGEERRHSMMRERLTESMEKVRRNFLADYLDHGNVWKNVSVKTWNEEYYMHFGDTLFRVGIIHVSGLQKQQVDIVLVYAGSYLENAMRPYVDEVLCLKRNTELICLFNYEEESPWREQLKEFFGRLVQKYEDVCSFSMGISMQKETLTKDMLAEAEHAMLYHLRLGAHKLIFYTSDMREQGRGLEKEWYKRLKKAVEIESQEQVMDCFGQVMNLVGEKVVDPVSLYMSMQSVASVLEQAASSERGEAPGFDGQKFKESLGQADTERELVKRAQQEVTGWLEQMSAQRMIKDSKYIRQAKGYIDANYARELSLEEVAGEVGINSSYFSSLFKKEQGINFSDYLTEVRITKAKELLEEGRLNVSEVGWAVGYKDQKYFSRLFYKLVGIKPSEYRKLYS